jgi:hypothetical protein
MTVSTEWFDELDGENQESGSIDSYIDVDGGGIQFNTDQISSASFDGGIPKSEPTNVAVSTIVPGDYVFWNLTTGNPVTVSLGADVDGDIDFTDDYADNLYLVVDIEIDDTNANPDSTTITRYLYLQDEEDIKRVSSSGSSTVTVIREANLSDWDSGTQGWLLTASGNAIFSNVLVRGTVRGSKFEIYSDTTDQLATNIPLTGKMTFRSINASSGALSDAYIEIDNSDSTIGSANLATEGVFRILGTARGMMLDPNEIQVSSGANGSKLFLQRWGGGIQIGGTGTGESLSDLDLYGNLTVSGSFSPASISTGAITASGAITFNTAGTIKLGNDNVNVNISQPSATGRALNVGGNVNIEGELSVDTLTGMSSNTIIVNDTFSVNGSLFADYVGAPRFVATTASDVSHFSLTNSNTAYTSDAISLRINDATGYNFMQFYNTATGGSAYADLKMRFQANGDLRIDGTLAQNGADYAEYFEWEDGNPDNEDRVGLSVSLINNKIKVCSDEETPIGVISYTATVIGDSAWNAWNKKYLKDDFGRLIVENYNVIKWYDEDENVVSYIENEIPEGIAIPENYEIVKKYKTTLNPEFNEDEKYIPREDRPEWSPVGLFGKIRIKKGQVTAPTWIKLRDISENVEEWLVK